MIISVFPNLNNKGVSVLAVNVVNRLISGGAEGYLSEEHEAVFAKQKRNLIHLTRLCQFVIAQLL